MFSVEIELLADRYTAGSDTTEWPPHPARLFYAAVALWAEGGQDRAEREALLWWEQQGTPIIHADALTEVAERTDLGHYVPGNDATVLTNKAVHELGVAVSEAIDVVRETGVEKAKAKAVRQVDKLLVKAIADSAKASSAKRVSDTVMAAQLKILPENRNRQRRTYPTVRPVHPRCVLEWSAAEPGAEIGESLDNLLGRVGRLGHSSTFVQCRVGTTAVDAHDLARWSPDSGHRSVRVASPGLLEELEMEYAQHQGTEPRTLPARTVSYGTEEVTPRQQPHVRTGDWLILELDSPRASERWADGRSRPISGTRTLNLTRTLRAALISHCTEPVPPVLSGHRGSQRLDEPHAAFLALPNVGNARSDGVVTSLAVSFPAEVSGPDLEQIEDAVRHFLAAGGELTWQGGSIRVAGAHWESATPQDRMIGRSVLRTASRQFWSRPSRRWTSVTPVALNRFPKALERHPIDWALVGEQLTDFAATACRDLGLPVPDHVAAVPGPPMAGIAPVGQQARGRSFPHFRLSNGQRRYTTHLHLQFAELVAGPVILGAGRYFGYGLMLPVDGPMT